MGKQRSKSNYRRRVLRLPDLDHCKLQRKYMEQLLATNLPLRPLQ